MPYVSELLGKPVADVDGTRIGHLDDLIATQRGDVPHPVVVAIVVKRSRGNLIVPIADVVVLIAPAIPLTKQAKDIEPYTPNPTDLYLARDVLDKQIIDTDGVRVVRVNDLELTRVNVDFYVANVDISGLGLMRRLGMGKVAQRFTGRSQRKGGPTGTISWDDIELLSPDQPMRLRVSSDRISDLHPADLAEIISDLTRTESDKLLESLDVETVAETLEEVEPEFQAALVETMPDERVADVLEEMSPDAAADLLAELPEERSEDLLNLMEKDDAADVRKLLSYPDDAAGGLMTTEFVAVPPDLTAEQTIAVLRDLGPDAETIYYVYAVDEARQAGRRVLAARSGHRQTPRAHRRIHASPRRDGQCAGQPGRCGARRVQIQLAGRARRRRSTPPAGHRHRRRRAGQDHPDRVEEEDTAVVQVIQGVIARPVGPKQSPAPNTEIASSAYGLLAMTTTSRSAQSAIQQSEYLINPDHHGSSSPHSSLTRPAALAVRRPRARHHHRQRR